MRNARLDEAHSGIKIAERNIKNHRYAEDTAIMAESKEKLTSFLMKVKKKNWLKIQHSENEDHGILSHQFSSVLFSQSVISESLWLHGLHDARPPCPSETPRVYSNSCPFIYLLKKIGGSKITTDGDCSHEIKEMLIQWKKSYDRPG